LVGDYLSAVLIFEGVLVRFRCHLPRSALSLGLLYAIVELARESQASFPGEIDRLAGVGGERVCLAGAVAVASYRPKMGLPVYARDGPLEEAAEVIEGLVGA
jgi:hypothetical protein